MCSYFAEIMDSAGSSHYSSNLSQQLLCFCGSKALLRTVHTENNIGRRFYGCPNYKSNIQCDFFKWFDPPISPRENEFGIVMLRRLMEMQLRKDELERIAEDLRLKNEELKTLNSYYIAREKKWKLVLIVVLVLCFSIWLNAHMVVNNAMNLYLSNV